MRLCIYALLYQLSYICLTSDHNIKLLVYPPFVHILYDECSEDVTEEYSSAKYQWRNWGGTLGAIVLSSREKLPFLKEYKNEIFRLVLPHFNFWPPTEKRCYASIVLRTGQILNKSVRFILFFHVLAIFLFLGKLKKVKLGFLFFVLRHLQATTPRNHTAQEQSLTDVVQNTCS